MKHSEEDGVAELGFFAVLAHRNGALETLLSAQPLTGGIRVDTASLTGWIKCFADIQVFHDEAGEITIIFYGHICGDISLPQFMNAYKTQRERAVELLNGSFALLLVDHRHDQIVWATDRLSSRKIYMRQRGSVIVVSTVLKHLFTDDLSIDPVGLAWYFSNGVFHNNRTMFEGISVANRASYYTFHANKPVKVQPYWQWQFTDEYAHKDPTRIKEEFESLLVESVRKRVDENSMNLLSLSAGYDSSGILGILSEKLNIDNLHSFSHGLHENEEESDAYSARHLAEMCNIRHRFLLSYDGDLCETIERNALWGNGIAHFCDESLVWSLLHEDYATQHCTLFVADEWFGTRMGDFELFNNADILAACKIRDFTCLRWLKPFLSHNIYYGFLYGQREDISMLFERIPPTLNLHDAKDFLYLDQRLPHILTPWREYFAGRTFRVQNPFLDNDIMDFMRQLPSQWRRGKRLYKEAIVSMFPKIFAIKRATVGGFVPDSTWANEINGKRPLLTERYLPSNRFSMLDAFIAPDSIIKLLSLEEEIPDRVGPVVEKVVSLSYRTVNKVLRGVGAKEIRRRKQFVLGRTTFLLRYLVLRRFLEIAEQQSMSRRLTLEV